ncbi:dihydrolipoyl dehydrogenase [Halorhodospira halophila]|uniref:FAD-dependent pyridine nucleotide-disulfide oxidoreductase n=1 Tax=Halorhodospira halophila (strain DSM 244 / SL1) TaxID=349124 RepID=A1WUR6_HALHL|nr:dihydrolipoyl dehydrogenase [Halorhodospira halophila]ABM61428.1 FAD-dependent pyridine nucleotide-disulfide oxidoreductase [Halorhodospira halophila SL1]MBK1728674.1 dihydrolipoyl dehydrogenase [Halorhodospira halophila]
MTDLDTDVAIIGAGSAGLRAYRSAAAHTNRVLLIEGGQYGTTCASVGCMPSKLLIAAADAAHRAHDAAGFGIHAGSVEVNGAEVMERVRSLRDKFVSGVVANTEKIPAERRIHGYARFEDARTLRLDDGRRIRAQRTVIATGSRPNVLPMFDGLGDRAVVNDDLFRWTDLPESVVVFGPGVIGMELGQALHRLGVRVRIFGIGGFLGPLTDPRVKDAAEEIFGDELALDTDAQVESLEREGNEVVVRFRDQSGALVEERFEYLLAATGRRPNVDNLGLETTGITIDDTGVPVFDHSTMQCGDQPIFIAGDANNESPVMPDAFDEGEIAGTNAGRYPDVQPGRRHCSMSIVFTEPQMALVGTRYADLPKDDYAIGEFDFSGQPRAIVMRENHGLIRLYGRPSDGTFLGGEVLGPRAEHLGHLLAWATDAAMTVDRMLDLPYYHPVLETGIRNALHDLKHKMRA